MIRLIAEAWMGLTAVMRALSFRADWDQRVNLTAAGLVRSFSAIFLTLPVFWFTLQGAVRLSAELSPGANFTYSPGEFLLDLVRIWLVFPVLAVFLTRLAGVKHRFVHWIVLHNWAVMFLFLVQALMFAFYLSGIMNAQAAATVYTLGYFMLRIFVHVRVAVSALGLPLGAGIAMGLIPVFIDFMIIQLLP
ncbi:hypothetical protein V0U79_03845 [Hyphobacterium sp. HN65]|uniref:Uncharacterized protein n=1 Tax=Hyphobacterium lacteum TaxID=3116575 RepID=A0ABU7LNI5_9PROT|nr:hypothetical protein [Hyphobacterium sp. HN65]MEE2525486.1 hypothetical protein [Hyphobacterium sp. HN65]